LILRPKLVKSALKSSTRRKTTIGLVEHISQSGVVKCGGVVVKEVKSNLVANFLSIFSKTIMKMILKLKKSLKRMRKDRKSMSSVHAAKK
jgi:hypothetical protein